MLGLQHYASGGRYSSPSSLRGSKLSLNEMSRTHSLKLRKVKEIVTARTHLPDYERKTTYRMADEDKLETNALFYSHSKVLKRTPSPSLSSKHPTATQSKGLLVEPNKHYRPEPQSQSQGEKEKEKVYFYSANLDQNMNLFMNRMLNRSEHERKEKIRQIEEKINLTFLDQINTSKTQNHFWRRMKRSISRKQQPISREESNSLPAFGGKAKREELQLPHGKR